MDVTAAKTKPDAIHQAAAELIRRKNLDPLKSLSGVIYLELDWKQPNSGVNLSSGAGGMVFADTSV